MSDPIKEFTYRDLTPDEIEFYMARGRKLRSEAFWPGAVWLTRRLRGGAARIARAANPAEAPLQFGPRVSGPLPHVD
jgi:hypothetical protein